MTDDQQPDGPYKVVPAEPPCDKCGRDHGFDVVQEIDGELVGTGTTYVRAEDAEDQAGELNDAFRDGEQLARAAAASTIRQLQDDIAKVRAALAAALRGKA